MTAGFVSALTILNLLLLNPTSASVTDGQEKLSNQQPGPSLGSTPGRSVRAAESQWAADPERGWIRVQERRMENRTKSAGQERELKKGKKGNVGKKDRVR